MSEEQLPLFDEPLHERYNRLAQRALPLIDALNEIRKEQSKLMDMMKAECKCENLVKESLHMDGSYYDKGYSKYWDQCKFCGKRYNERSEMGSYG